MTSVHNASDTPAKLDLSQIDRMISDCVLQIERKRAEIAACYADFDACMHLIRELDEMTAALDKLEQYRRQVAARGRGVRRFNNLTSW